MRKGAQIFKLLAKPVQNVLEELELLEPTEPQLKAIPFILKGENILLIAPTGSGKTEAVLLPIFSKLLKQPKKQGISVLYITPLRALNRDMRRRMSYWAIRLHLSIQVRHGDTKPTIRRKQAVCPPDILVTTPETLQAILPGSRMQKHLKQIRYVVVDEVHELATNKRGAQLSLALERLSELVEKDFQRIGLSATVANSEKVARFIGGARRPVRIIQVWLTKDFAFTIDYPTPDDADFDLARKLGTAPEAAARIRHMLDLVRKHVSTLIFVNSRTNAEMLGHRFNLLTDEIGVHHGSLSREERQQIEDEFKENALKAIVCTSTMELGVDIGHVDLVVQYLSPRQVGSLIQRVGRSGHRLGLVSKGVIVTAFSEDVLESLAAVRRARQRALEPLLIHENALDVAGHQIAGVLMDKQTTTVDEIMKIFRRTYTFRKLSRTKLLQIINYLDTLREAEIEGEVLKKTRWTRDYYYRNLSMIPDERRYPIVDILSDRKIGTLGDEFMALRARIGLNFICKGKVWRIVQIEDQTGMVYVTPAEDKFAAVPGWDGEMIPIPFDLAVDVGRLREEIAHELIKSRNVEETAEKLAEMHGLGKAALLESVREIDVFLKENLPLPTHNCILLEAYDKYVVVHACFGEIVNRTLGSIFDALLSDQTQIVGWWNDGYRILIEAPQKVEKKTFDEIFRLLFSLTPTDVDKAFNKYVEARFPFAYKMKFVAERFGALPRGKTMSPQRMAELPSRFQNTPVYDEVIREAMIEKVDMPNVKKIMKHIKEGKIKVSAVLRLDKPTPLAYHILAKHLEASALMAPESVVLSNIERMKKSILTRKANLFCLSCGQIFEEKRIRELPEKLVCKKCGSGLLAKLMRSQDPRVLHSLLKQRQKGKKLTPEELEELVYSRRTADLILSYGRKAVEALQVRGVGPETAFRILGKMHPNDDDFFIDLLKAKINFIKSYPYWKDRKNNKKKVLRGETD